jgi:hypothetical protein
MRVFVLVSMLTALSQAAEVKPASARGANDKMEILATVYPSKDLVKGLLGDDMGGFIYVMEVTLKPRTEDTIRIDRDDFQILLTNDGQRSKPFSPAQLTGKGALVIKSKPGPTSGVMGQNNGPVWGGVGGPPVMMPGQGTQIGSGTANTDSAHAEVLDEEGAKENPMKKVLEAKELPQTEMTSEPIKGYLYFPVDGKHKAKDVMLQYKGVGGRIDIEFRELKK